MATEQILFLLILAAALVMFISGKLRIDLVAMLVLMALALTGILDGRQALSGFSSEPAIIVASVFVLSGGLAATGLTDRLGAWIGLAAGGSEWRMIAVVMPAVAVLSAFSHHLMVTAMMLPIIMRLAREHQLPASRLLMPMSLSASLGTTLTLFSAPAFLLANNLLVANGREGLGLFAIAPIGGLLVLLGLAYMLLGRWLLPRRSGESVDNDYLRLERYYTELVVEAKSPWIGKPLLDLRRHYHGRLQVAESLREGLAMGERERAALAAGDVLLVRATPDEIMSVGDESGLALHAVAKYGEAQADGSKPGGEQLVQAVVAPHSELVGRTVGDIDFLKTLGVVVVGLWRREGWLSGEMSEVTLAEGDLLVLWGKPVTFSELAGNRAFLMLVPLVTNPRQRHRAPLALFIMAAAVFAAATELLPAHIAFLAGAVTMVLTRCIGVEQAYKQIDVRIFVMIAGVIPLGLAMEKTGTAALFATHLVGFVDGMTPLVVLLLVFWSSAMLTQVLSDAATTVLLGPVAISLATALHLPPEPFVVCTAMGAVASFLTPIGHHGNLLILNPGQYTFGDFLRVGVPLTVMISLVCAWVARWLWLGGPLWPTPLY